MEEMMARSKEQVQKYNQTQYQRAIEAGLCVRCMKQPPMSDKKVCMECSKSTTQNTQQRIARHRLAGLCMCGNPPMKDMKLCRTCQEKVRQTNKKFRANHGTIYARQRTAQLRDIVFEAYGNLCACCGEERRWTLQLDHVYNNGAEHRRQVGKHGDQILKWAIEQKFPDSLQLLCANCNFGKANSENGECPHKIELYIRNRNW